MNEHQKALIEGVTHAFDHANVAVDAEFRSRLHYTAVIPITGALKKQLVALQQAYLSFDDSLQLVMPELLHISLGQASIEEGYERLEDITRLYIAKHSTVFCAGLVANDSRGALGVACWPKGDDFFLNYRQALAEAYGRSFVADARSHIGWATLARFTSPPPRELIAFVQENAFMEFGEFSLDRAIIYKPQRRDLRGSEIIVEI